MKLTLTQANILKILDREEGHEVSAQSLCRQMTGTPIEQTHGVLLDAVALEVRRLGEAGLLECLREGAGASQSVAITRRGSLALRQDARRHGHPRRLMLASLAGSATFAVICLVLVIVARV